MDRYPRHNPDPSGGLLTLLSGVILGFVWGAAFTAIALIIFGK